MQLIEITRDLLSDYISSLTEMNICLRADEKMDNSMADEDVRQRMVDFITGNVYKTYVLQQEQTILGYGLIDSTKTPMYLRQLFIHRAYRGKKYGSVLIEFMMRDLNIDTIDLEVMAWNQKAIQFYEDFGFVRRYVGMRYAK